MTEKLSQLAHKIDFSAEASDEKGKQISEGEKAEEEKTPAFQASLWPWDSVRTHLKWAFQAAS